MKRFFKPMLAGILTFALLFCLAACGGDGGTTTKSPTNVPNTQRPSANPTMGGNTNQPSGSPDNSGEPGSGSPVNSPDGGSAQPTGGPDNTEGAGGENIDGFENGKVVDPEEIPEITAAVEAMFEGRTIQSITYETYSGRQAYRITLQGEGQLAKLIYAFPDGTLVIPAESD